MTSPLLNVLVIQLLGKSLTFEKFGRYLKNDTGSPMRIADISYGQDRSRCADLVSRPRLCSLWWSGVPSISFVQLFSGHSQYFNLSQWLVSILVSKGLGIIWLKSHTWYGHEGKDCKVEFHLCSFVFVLIDYIFRLILLL